MLDNWFRYWDLVRWHQLDKMDTESHPNITLGANLGAETFDGVNKVGNYMKATTAKRTFDKKYYLYPIPTQQITLNPAIKQNFGWTE